MLLAHGADPAAANTQGSTPYDALNMTAGWIPADLDDDEEIHAVKAMLELLDQNETGHK